MNTTQRNNQRHELALKQYDDFVKAGKVPITAPDSYEGQTWQAPKPRGLVMPDNTGRKKKSL